jgi:signal transduction histidine kinase
MLHELSLARGERERSLTRQREFVADASHELRTPLTSVLANLELLGDSRNLAPDSSEREALDSALRSGLRMKRLVSDLQILARADAGRSIEMVSSI